MTPAGKEPAPDRARDIALAAARIAGWCGDLAGLVLRREPAVNSAAVGMSMLAHNFSSRRAAAELGYTYRSFEATVQDAWGWFVDRGYARPVKARTALAR